MSTGAVLVTGVPRSGTTWLARELARSRGTALGGREPMTPRGRQFALAGTLNGWVRLTEPSARQRRALRTGYRGLDPRVFSRYGHRQWAAPLPWTRVVVKDPFALLSLPAVVATTGARVVLVFRHPAAVLASYRRMGWAPDLEELSAVLAGTDLRDDDGHRVVLPRPGEVDDVEAMARFWDVLHRLALADTADLPGLVVVDHEDVAAADGRVLAAARAALDLPPVEASTAPGTTPAPAAPVRSPEGDGALHRLDRAPEQAAQAWRSQVDPAEAARCEALTGPTRARLDALRLRA